jgi:hypothetical protein
MQCRSCGTEIADKAIVCYRCGAGTTDPVRRPVPIRATRRTWPSLLGAAVPLVLALVLIVESDATAYPKAMVSIAAVLAGLGIVLLITRVVRRR